MTKWTSISVTETQKEQLKNHKPDGMSMGDYLTSAIDANNTMEDAPEGTPDELKDLIQNGFSQLQEEGIRAAVESAFEDHQADVDVDGEALARLLSKKLGSDLEQAAYRGTKDALEDVLR